MADAPIVFVNSLAVRGFLNGVINLALNTAKFLPEDVNGETKVTSQDVITVNLRMDLYCAQQVYEAIGKILQEQTRPTPKEVN
jgi:hypothetical protein